MQIFNRTRLEEAWQRHADAEPALKTWLAITLSAKWHNYLELRNTFKTADPVKLESGTTVTVFNVKGNSYRLITTVDYRRQIVAVWYFLTHAEYDKEKWKRRL